jgi:hypothetical protein
VITPEEAVEVARRATVGKAILHAQGPVRVDHKRGTYVVTFVHEQPSGVRGPDYDAQVTVDAERGDVIQVLGAS